MALFTHFVTDPYAVPGIAHAVLFSDNGLAKKALRFENTNCF
jgi:hypothetical protein